MKLDEARKLASMQPGWLAQTPQVFRHAILSRCTLHRYASGQALHAEGDDASSMYGIVQGQVKVYMSASDGTVYLTHILTTALGAEKGRRWSV